MTLSTPDQTSPGFDVSTPVTVLDPGDVGFGIARSLGRLGVPVFGVHGDAQAPGARSRYWRGNFQWNFENMDVEASITRLQEIATVIGTRSILIPTDDATCLFVAEHSESLREAFLFPEGPVGLPRSLSSKRGMYLLCKQHGIPTPETVFPRSRDDVVEWLRNASFPVMLKGIYTFALRDRTGVTMVVAEDERSLLDWYDKLETPDSPNLMLQEYIPGGPEEVWMFDGYFNHKSDCLLGITGKKIRQTPPYTGRTCLGICIQNDDVQRQTTDFMKRIRYRGILDLGYKFDSRDGQYKLLDVNPRIGMTFRLFVDDQGLDVARVLYLDLTGQTVTSGQPLEGRKWIVENLDLRSSLLYWRDGQLSPASWIQSFSGVREGCWYARDDMRPLGTMVVRSIQRGMEQILASTGQRLRSA